MDTLWAYFTGDPPLQKIDRERAEDLREFIRMARANYPHVIVSGMLDKITLLGIRSDDDDDADGNDEFRRILSMSGPWLRDALAYTFVMGVGLVMIGKGDEPGMPVVTAEDPRLCSWITDPLDPSRVKHALKTYTDEDGVKHAHLFTGDLGKERVRVATLSRNGWEWDEGRSGALPVQGIGLPLVPLENAFGLGEFEPHLDVVDRINNQIADRLWTVKIQAFRQRALESIDSDAEAIPSKDPETGEDIDVNDLFRAAPDALWDLPPGRKMWESTPVDITNVLLAARDDVKELAAGSKTPLFMFTPDAASGSAEGASSMKEGLEDKCRDRIERFTPPVRRISRHILAYAGKTVPQRLSPQWASVERHSLQTKTASAANAKNAGVPLETILAEILQFPPEVVKRAMDQKVAEALVEALAGTTPNQQVPTPPQPVSGNG
ncbi:MAG: phage portal protein [Streptomycetaceae bacterium]|nr:phage portal protein [Streptomycetaceae bacterium]